MLNAKDLIGKIQFVDANRVHTLTLKEGWNFRELASYTSSDLDTTLPIEGQRDACTLYEFSEDDLRGPYSEFAALGVKPGDYAPIQGNIRSLKIKEMMLKGVIDPQTMRRDETTGEPIPGTGKVFSTVRALVLKNLSRAELFSLMSDHSTKGLTDVEVFLQLERGLREFGSAKKVVIKYRYLFEARFSKEKNSKHPLTDAQGHLLEDALFKFRRGAIQLIEAVYYGPTVVREAYLKSLRGQQNWPTEAEIKQNYVIYSDEKSEDDKAGRCQYSKDNPGPKFMAAWNAVLATVEEAKAEGTRRKKAASKNVDEVNTLFGKAQSRAFRFALMVQQNRVTAENTAKFDEVMVEFEAGKIDSAAFQVAMNDLFGTVAKTEAVAAEVAEAA